MVKRDKRTLGYQDPDLIKAILDKNAIYLQSLRKRKIDPGTVPSLLSFLPLFFQKCEMNHVRVHEIGGGSGHLYQTFRMLFQDIQTEWTNIETPTMVSAIEGKNFPGLRHIKWNDFILNNNLGSDIVIANSSLQYFENPIKTLSDFLSVVEAKFLFIGKSPISANSQQVGIQISKLSSNGPQYKSQPIGSDAFREKCKIITYPIRTISENELLNLLDSWRIVFSFPEGYIDFDVSCSIFAPFFEHRFCKMQRIQTHSILFEKK